MYTYNFMSIYIISICMHACTHVCLHVCAIHKHSMHTVHLYLHAYIMIYIYTHAYIYIYMYYACMHIHIVYIHYMHSCRHTRGTIHTCLHAYIHYLHIMFHTFKVCVEHSWYDQEPYWPETLLGLAAMERRQCAQLPPDSSLLTRLMHLGAPKASSLQRLSLLSLATLPSPPHEVLIATTLLILWSTNLPVAKSFDLLDLFSGAGNASLTGTLSGSYIYIYGQ